MTRNVSAVTASRRHIATMQSTTTTTTIQETGGRRSTRSNTDLVSLSAPVFEALLKLKSGLASPSAELRPAFEEMLAEIAQRGATLRYSEAQVQAVKFALVAFIDEVVLSLKFPLRDKWEKFPLQLKYFDEHLAGVTFFTRLNELLARVETEADVVEVYYLCLLFGFKGKYKIFLEAQLKGVVEHTAEELRRAGRLRAGELSPHWQAHDQPAAPRNDRTQRWINAGLSAAGLLVLLYALLSLLLSSNLSAAREQLLR